ADDAVRVHLLAWSVRPIDSDLDVRASLHVTLVTAVDVTCEVDAPGRHLHRPASPAKVLGLYHVVTHHEPTGEHGPLCEGDGALHRLLVRHRALRPDMLAARGAGHTPGRRLLPPAQVHHPAHHGAPPCQAAQGWLGSGADVPLGG